MWIAMTNSRIRIGVRMGRSNRRWWNQKCDIKPLQLTIEEGLSRLNSG